MKTYIEEQSLRDAIAQDLYDMIKPLQNELDLADSYNGPDPRGPKAREYDLAYIKQIKFIADSIKNKKLGVL